MDYIYTKNTITLLQFKFLKYLYSQIILVHFTALIEAFSNNTYSYSYLKKRNFPGLRMEIFEMSQIFKCTEFTQLSNKM
jgi:hypothetical protein